MIYVSNVNLYFNKNIANKKPDRSQNLNNAGYKDFQKKQRNNYAAKNIAFTASLRKVAYKVYNGVMSNFFKLGIPVTIYDTPAIIEARKKQVTLRDQLRKQLGVNITALINTTERAALRVNILNKMIEKGISVNKDKTPELYIVIGLNGSGKSSALEKPLVDKLDNAVVIDSDIAKKYLPEYNNGLGTFLVNDESALIEEKGYDVHLRFVSTKPSSAAKRAIYRFQTDGRFADPLAHQLFGRKPEKTYHRAIKEFPTILNSYAAYSNDVPLGNKPEFIKDLSNIDCSEV